MWNKFKCWSVGLHNFQYQVCKHCHVSFKDLKPCAVERFFCFIGLHDDEVYEVLHETERGQAMLVCHECKSCGNIKYE